MQVRDKLNLKNQPTPMTFTPKDTVKSALKVMCDKNIGSIIVTQSDGTVAGVVTERDMMTRVLNKGKDPATTKLSQIMTRDVYMAYETDNLMDWMHTMSHKRFRHLPVVTKDNKLICVISQGDFLAFTWPDLYEKIKTDMKGYLGPIFQAALIMLTLITLGLIFLERVSQ